MRADASFAIGSGHVARCLTLAQALRAGGAQVSFACRSLPGDLLAAVAVQGFEVYRLPAPAPGCTPAPGEAPLPWRNDIDALASALGPQACFDWIVLDHYGLDHHWQRAARQWAARIAAIDDLANRHHAVDLLLDQNYLASEPRYQPWLDGPCQCLLGPRYALLRDEFRGPARAVRPLAEHVLVNFGGMDNARQTLKAAQALTGFAGLQVTLVAGLGNADIDALQALAAERAGWRLLTHSAAFGQLMASADVFIGAGGGTSWERASLGLPTLCMAVADNQRANAEALAAAGIQGYLGPCEGVTVAARAGAIGVLLGRFGLRQQYAERSRQLVDGYGAQRVALAMQSRPVPA